MQDIVENMNTVNNILKFMYIPQLSIKTQV